MTLAFFLVLYSRIGYEILRRKKMTIGSKINSSASKNGNSSQALDPTSTEMSSEIEENTSGETSKKSSLAAMQKALVKQSRGQTLRVGKNDHGALRRHPCLHPLLSPVPCCHGVEKRYQGFLSRNSIPWGRWCTSSA